MEAYETIEYRGFEIQIHHDDSPMNPWTDWDCEPPLFVRHGRDYSISYDLDLRLPQLTDDEIRRNARDIAKTLDRETLLAGIRNYLRYDLSYYGDAVTAVNDALEDYSETLNQSELMELVAEMYEWQGIPTYQTTKRGYSQSDWCDLLLVATPEWAEKVGAPAESLRRQLESAADLYAQWAFGDVYGFIVEDENGDFVDSCWGFYGDDWDNNGLLEHAKPAIDYHIERKRDARIDRLKTLIKNRVPLSIRQLELA